MHMHDIALHACVCFVSVCACERSTGETEEGEPSQSTLLLMNSTQLHSIRRSPQSLEHLQSVMDSIPELAVVVLSFAGVSIHV